MRNRKAVIAATRVLGVGESQTAAEVHERLLLPQLRGRRWGLGAQQAS
jgi:hypothetical protein